MMWTLRRTSIPLRSQGFSIGASHISCVKVEIPSTYIADDKTGTLESLREPYDRFQPPQSFCHPTYGSSKLFVARHSFSSQAGAKSSREEDLENGFSKLETPSSAEVNQDVEDESDDELISKPDLAGDDVEEASQVELELSDTETDPSEKKTPRKRAHSALFKVILAASGSSCHSILDKWVAEGNELSQAEILLAMLHLRRRRMYGRALQLSEWLETNKHLDFAERDYTSRLDLIARVQGLQMAENYISKIPKSIRGEEIYGTLLANCAAANNATKAEEIFNKMRDLNFPITSFACNQLLLLYKRHDRKKIPELLLLMEKENVKPTLFTYKILIDVKGRSNDITGMDQIVETMKAEGMAPDNHTQFILAKHYVSNRLAEKAEAILKEMEGDVLKNRWVCQLLLLLYAQLGKADEVNRIWKACESNPWLEECMAAIDAFGRLKKIEEAEAVFEMVLKAWKVTSKPYTILLRVYANHKLLAKGKDLIKRMSDSGCRIGPLTWDALIKLYVQAGDVERAASILQKVTEQNLKKPMFSSYMVIMQQYAKWGDVHNSEKMFHRMREAGYLSRLRQFQVLIGAYVNARAPAYGLRERMKADNIFPNRALEFQLAQVDAFRKTAVSVCSTDELDGLFLAKR